MSYGIGVMLFVIELAFRATIVVTVARTTGSPPGWFEPLRTWAGAMVWGYMILAYLGCAAVGAAILQTSVLSDALGWAAVTLGLPGTVVYLATLPRWLWTLLELPGVLHVLTGLLGAGLLIEG